MRRGGKLQTLRITSVVDSNGERPCKAKCKRYVLLCLCLDWIVIKKSRNAEVLSNLRLIIAEFCDSL